MNTAKFAMLCGAGGIWRYLVKFIRTGKIIKLCATISLMMSLCLILPIFTAFYYKEFFVVSKLLPFTIGLCLISLLLFFLIKEKYTAISKRTAFFIVTLSWIISAIISCAAFVITGAIPSPIDAFFESCSGLSTTGITILNDVEAIPKSMNMWRAFLHWIGGMGILVFAVAILPSLKFTGQSVASAEAPGPSFEKVSPKVSDTAKILYVTYSLFTVLEIILLMLSGLSLYDSVIHSFSTLGTGGFSCYNDSIGHFGSPLVSTIIIFFMFLAGTNFNLFFFSIKDGIKTFMSSTEFKTYLSITLLVSFAVGMILFLKTHETPLNAAVNGTFQTVSFLTTTGFSNANFNIWPVASKTLLFTLFFIGGSSTSTAGGIKIIRVAVVLRLIKRGIETRLHPEAVKPIRIDKKNVSSTSVSLILSFIFLYVLIAFIGSLVISLENHSSFSAVTLSMTCIGNIGPSFFENAGFKLADFNMLSKFTMSLLMIIGRLELFTIIMLMLPKLWRDKKV